MGSTSQRVTKILLLFIESWKMFTKGMPWEMKSMADIIDIMMALVCAVCKRWNAELVSDGC